MATPQRAVRSSAPPERRRFTLQTLIALVLFAGAIGLTSYLLLADEQARAASTPQTRALGQALSPTTDPRATARRLSRAFLAGTVTLHAAERRYVMTRAALGVAVDADRLSALLSAARDAASPLRKLHAQVHGTAPLIVPIPAQLSGRAARSWLETIADELAEPARQARIDHRTHEQLPARTGRTLDVEGTLDALADAVFHGRDAATARFFVRHPAGDAAKSDGPLALAGLHGSFESTFSEGDRIRAHNLRAAARSLDGALVAPGQVFDFRAQIAEAIATGRFRPGAVVPDEPDAIAAAVGQLAGTLHAAALLAGLPIVEQAPPPHPSHAVDLGFDTAIDRQHNLRFKNDLPTPIAIGVTVKEGRVRAFVRGAPSAIRDVELARAVEQSTAFDEVRRDDPTLPRGTTQIARGGTPGLRVVLVRRIRDPHDGRIHDDERAIVYPPRAQLVRVGAASRARAAPTASIPPEPLYDEYLALRLRRGHDLPEVFARHAGRTGTRGWTQPEASEALTR